MSGNRSYSLLTLILLIAIAAFAVSHIAMRTKVAESTAAAIAARAEVEMMRLKFGHIEVDDPSLTYVARVHEDHSGYTSYRLNLPAGSRYMLHISDTEMTSSEIPDALDRTKTLSMNGWREGADVLLQFSTWIVDDVPVMTVRTHDEPLCKYQIKNWREDATVPSEGWDLVTDPQKSFRTDERIHFTFSRAIAQSCCGLSLLKAGTRGGKRTVRKKRNPKIDHQADSGFRTNR